jgi:hypothetical protein
MAGSFSNYAAHKVLDHITGKTSFTMPTVWVALCTAAPTDASTGATLVEATYTAYARKSTVGSDWNVAAGRVTANAAAITFVQCSGSTSAVTHFALVDSATTADGNVLAWGALGATLAVSNGVQPVFAIGALDLTVTAGS